MSRRQSLFIQRGWWSLGSDMVTDHGLARLVVHNHTAVAAVEAAHILDCRAVVAAAAEAARILDGQAAVVAVHKERESFRSRLLVERHRKVC